MELIRGEGKEPRREPLCSTRGRIGTELVHRPPQSQLSHASMLLLNSITAIMMATYVVVLEHSRDTRGRIIEMKMLLQSSQIRQHVQDYDDIGDEKG